MWNACSSEAALDNRFPPCSFCFISLMLPTRRIRGALVLWLAPRVEQHLLGRIACESTKNFFYFALLATQGCRRAFQNTVLLSGLLETGYIAFAPPKEAELFYFRAVQNAAF